MPTPHPTVPVALLFAALLAAAPSAATAGTTPEAFGAWDGDEARLAARLVADPLGGGLWRVGVELAPDPDWHVYWRNPGETGLATHVDWTLASGSVGELSWPVPRAFRDAAADLVSYGYDAPVLLATRARVAAKEPVVLRADVEALVCADRCIPGTFALETTLDPRKPRVEAVRSRFDATEKRLPQPAQALGVEVEVLPREAGAARRRATLVVHPCGRSASSCSVGPAGGGGPALFPYASDAWEWRASPPRPHEAARGAFAVDLEAVLFEAEAEPRLAGVIPLRDGAERERSVEIRLPANDGSARTAVGPWLRAALLGLLGGLLLNLMPCVLPVLAIKLHGLAALARSARRSHYRHAAAYAAGITSSMLALAGVVLALRAAGSAVGWGFQLQEPRFVLAVAALLVAFALNLFGAFEIRLDTAALGRLGPDVPGTARSFFDGLLAVALATPCSAPFLGTAVGFAFAGSPAVIVSTFLAIGAGLASPFVLAALYPGWTRWLPRSGAWMHDLRGALGFALLLSALWLLWILGRTAGSDALAGALLALLGLAAALWGLGLLQHRGRNVAAGVLALGLVGAGVAGLGVVDLSPQGAAPAAPLAPRPFTADELRASLRAGRPAFVYFTADWCITCKVNERNVLASPRVAAELERLGYDVYRADWTRRDDAIRRALARLGKAGVPVYALYADASAPPTLLPELLTVSGFLDALRENAPAAARS